MNKNRTMCNFLSKSIWFLFLCAFFVDGFWAQQIPTDINTITWEKQNANLNGSVNKNQTLLAGSTKIGKAKQHTAEDNVEQTLLKAVLTKAEFDNYVKSLSMVRGELCRRDLNATLWGIIHRDQWATTMYDATVKSSVGLESGVQHQFGHFDQCLNQQQSSGQNAPPIRAQYCLVSVHVNGLNVLEFNSRAKQSAPAFWGVCVPDSCDGDDVNAHISTWLQQDLLEEAPLCQSPASTKLHMSNSMFIYACVICFFVLLAVSNTLYHIYILLVPSSNNMLHKDNGQTRNATLTVALLSFSIIENFKKLFQPSKDQNGLNSINGIKALAMLFILAGHALSFIFGGPMYNAKFINDQLQLPTFSFLTNSLLFVDTFLLLSGFLFCRILLLELERRNGKINVLVLYVARYIRLTPAYMAVLGFYMTWFPYAGSGPIWQQRIGLEQQRCESSWWLNMLYINNYFNTNQLCMFQSWYLAVDSQLFFVAPVVIYILHNSRVLGLRFLAALVVLTAAVPFVITYVEQLDPTLMVYADEVSDLARNNFYISSYIKTHMRASAYMIGLLVGYLVHLVNEKQMKLSTYLVRRIWLASVFIGMGSMYGVTRFYIAPYTLLESSLYAGFHKIGWNLSVGWLVFAVTTGHAVGLSRVLSARFFAPISRLTFCAYLCNGIVELYHMASMRHSNYMGYISLFNGVFSHIFDTFILAVLVCLLFESPIHALERVLLRNVAGAEPRRGNHGTGNKGKDSASTSEETMSMP